MRISRDPRNTPPGPAMAIRFAAIPVVLLSVHGASVATVSSPSPTARATHRHGLPDTESQGRVPDGEGEGRVPDRHRPPAPGSRAAHQHHRRPDHGAGG